MALTSIKFLPGVDKQDTSVGANGRWVDSDNARFRYGLPEKVGGWASLLSDTTSIENVPNNPRRHNQSPIQPHPRCFLYFRRCEILNQLPATKALTVTQLSKPS